MTESEKPKPKLNEVLVKVEFAGVNFIDTYQRQGLPSYNLTTPFTPGLEGAGIVEEVGDGVSEFKSGDKVAWCSAIGSYAQFNIISKDKLVKVPDQLDLKIAASIMLQGLTAQYLSHSTFEIKEGDIALVHAAAGGTGRLLCQMILNKGGQVIATTSSDEKKKLVEEIGVKQVIRYDKNDVVEAVKNLTNQVGVNVVYDGVGKNTFDGSLSCLKKRGMMVLFGASSGAVPPFDLQRLNAGGSLYITRPSLFHYISTPEEFRNRSESVFKMIINNELKVNIFKEYKLSETSLAHKDLESGKTFGKLIINTST